MAFRLSSLSRLAILRSELGAAASTRSGFQGSEAPVDCVVGTDARQLSTTSSLMSEHEVCIVSAIRTPLGSFQGSISSLSATQLGSLAIKGALAKASIRGNELDEVLFGNVLSANLGQAPSRQAALGAGVPYSVPCTDVNKVCASGMKAVMLAAQSIQLGQNRIVAAGGMESMSNVPHYIKARGGLRLGHSELIDGMIKDGLWDPYSDVHMGNCAEICATHYNFSRNQQDDHALQSWRRAKIAAESGHFQEEILPVEIPAKHGRPNTIVATDEALEKMDAERLRNLRPVFLNNGSVTAGNASPISDGAACLILASREAAEQHGLTVLARVRAYADAAQEPKWFTTTPALAIQKALQKADLDVTEVDCFEINEAFSVVDLANQKILNLDPARVNIHGGAVALGHPIGCSGARILVTLTHLLQQQQARFGVASICNGGGGASAVVIERCN